MKPGCFFPAMALIAAFCMALASITSAAHMAPVGANAPDYQAYVATGGLDDLCESETTHNADHDCPFCRELADPEDLTPTTVAWVLEVPPDALRQHSIAARGPPCAA